MRVSEGVSVCERERVRKRERERERERERDYVRHEIVKFCELAQIQIKASIQTKSMHLAYL